MVVAGPPVLNKIDASLTLTELSLLADKAVLQCIHYNNCQFPLVHYESVKRHFGIRRAFVMLPEAIKYFGGHMAKIIEFYIPQGLHKVSKWLPPAERGKVLAFPQTARKSA